MKLMSWNVRGMNADLNEQCQKGVLKLQRANSYSYKKQNWRLLMMQWLDPYVQFVILALFIIHPLVCQVVSFWYGILGRGNWKIFMLAFTLC